MEKDEIKLANEIIGEMEDFCNDENVVMSNIEQVSTNEEHIVKIHFRKPKGQND